MTISISEDGVYVDSFYCYLHYIIKVDGTFVASGLGVDKDGENLRIIFY